MEIKLNFNKKLYIYFTMPNYHRDIIVLQNTLIL